jgi:hypothetical protein
MSPNEENVSQFLLCVNHTYSELVQNPPDNQGPLDRRQNTICLVGEMLGGSKLKKLLDKITLPEAG